MKALMPLIVLTVILTGCGGGSWNIEPNPVIGTDPAIRITAVKWHNPTFFKDFSIKVDGKVYNLDNISDYHVSIYIHVPQRGWWPKPTFASPFTDIQSNMVFSNRVNTGEQDEHLDGVHVYLVKKSNNWIPKWSGLPGFRPEFGIIAEDEVWKPENQVNHVDQRGVSHEF